MINPSIWGVYCDAYAHFGSGPVTARSLLQLGVSEPMCRKAIWVLKREGFLRRLGRSRGGWIEFEIVSPFAAAMKFALAHPGVARREIMNLFMSVQAGVREWYLSGVTALCYYVYCYSPRIIIATREHAKLKDALAPFWHIMSEISDRIPREYERAEFGPVEFKVASPEDAVVECYCAWPSEKRPLGMSEWPQADFMTAVVMRAIGRRFRTRALAELPERARNHVEEVRKLAFSRGKWVDSVGEEAEKIMRLSPEARMAGLVEILGSVGGAVCCQA